MTSAGAGTGAGTGASTGAGTGARTGTGTGTSSGAGTGAIVASGTGTATETDIVDYEWEEKILNEAQLLQKQREAEKLKNVPLALVPLPTNIASSFQLASSGGCPCEPFQIMAQNGKYVGSCQSFDLTGVPFCYLMKGCPNCEGITGTFPQYCKNYTHCRASRAFFFNQNSNVDKKSSYFSLYY